MSRVLTDANGNVLVDGTGNALVGNDGSIDLSLVRLQDVGHVNTKNGLIKYGYDSGSNYSLLLDNSDNCFALIPTQPFEIGVIYKIISLPTRANVLYGSSLRYWRFPSTEIQTNGIWAGYSIKGYTWNYGLSIVETPVIGTSYFVKYKYDGTNFKLSITSDYIQYKEQSVIVSATHYFGSDVSPCLGGLQESSAHCCSCAEINLKGTYIKSNGVLVWGCDYLEQNNIFE